MSSKARPSARNSAEGRRAQRTGERQEAYQLRRPPAAICHDRSTSTPPVRSAQIAAVRRREANGSSRPGAVVAGGAQTAGSCSSSHKKVGPCLGSRAVKGAAFPAYMGAAGRGKMASSVRLVSARVHDLRHGMEKVARQVEPSACESQDIWNSNFCPKSGDF